MNKQNRRAFLQISAGALATGLSPRHATRSFAVRSDGRAAGPDMVQIPHAVAENEGKKPLRLGLILGIGRGPDAAMAKVHEIGLPTCQVFVGGIEAGLNWRLRAAR